MLQVSRIGGPSEDDDSLLVEATDSLGVNESLVRLAVFEAAWGDGRRNDAIDARAGVRSRASGSRGWTQAPDPSTHAMSTGAAREGQRTSRAPRPSDLPSFLFKSKGPSY